MVRWENPDNRWTMMQHMKINWLQIILKILVFNPIDEEGMLINPPPTPTNATKD